ncbi:MAG: SCO family protein [Ideonella sp.]|nr:SCO family protein [Ideonella sp.]
MLMSPLPDVRRRQTLGLALAAPWWAVGAVAQPAPLPAAKPPLPNNKLHKYPFGPIKPPRPVPALALTTHTGAKTNLVALTRGKLTAIQLMFTGCSAVCPIQGAIFAAAQRKLAKSMPQVQWLSLSIDPLGDDPKALAAWLKRHGAQPGWTAAVPGLKDSEALFDMIGRRSQEFAGDVDRHTAQVFIADRQARLVFSTANMPSPEVLEEVLREIDPLKL